MELMKRIKEDEAMVKNLEFIKELEKESFSGYFICLKETIVEIFRNLKDFIVNSGRFFYYVSMMLISPVISLFSKSKEKGIIDDGFGDIVKKLNKENNKESEMAKGANKPKKEAKKPSTKKPVKKGKK